jgi:hypothetical protein
VRRPSSGPGHAHSILYAFSSVTDRTDPYEIIGVRRDASLAEIRISYRRSTQILAPERFANANDTVRAEAARRLTALNGAMEAIEAERAAESGSALGSLTFGGPAVSPAAEPSLRSIAVVDDLPPLEHEAEATHDGLLDAPMIRAGATHDEFLDVPIIGADATHDELLDAPIPHAATSDDLADAPDTAEEALPEPVAAPEPEAPAAIEPDAPTGEQSWRTEDDTQDGMPPITGEDTAEVPVDERDPEPQPAPSLLETPNPPAVAAPQPAAPRFERERPSKSAPRTGSLLPRILGACALVAGLAAIAAYFLIGGGSGKPAALQFNRASAPVSFSYPNGLVVRKPPSGGLLKPTFSTAVGVDAANYVVVATYHISADVQADGSAIGTGGSRLTVDRFDESVDRAAERIASAQKLKAKGLAQPGKAGDLIARVYDYTRPGGSSARYAFAFRGHTEYSIACFWDPAHAKALSAACDQVMTSLQRETP